MTALEEALFKIAMDLEYMEVNWALVGGMAFGIRAEPRTTVDVDVAVAVRTERGLDDLIRGRCCMSSHR